LQGRETAERVPLVGTPHGRALAAQAVEVIVEDGGARLFAPVTSRGEAVGVLQFSDGTLALASLCECAACKRP
jgi:hypothetical protein